MKTFLPHEKPFAPDDLKHSFTKNQQGQLLHVIKTASKEKSMAAMAGPDLLGALKKIRNFSSAMENREEPLLEGAQEITRICMAAIAKAETL